jgi:hypothetical protein
MDVGPDGVGGGVGRHDESTMMSRAIDPYSQQSSRCQGRATWGRMAGYVTSQDFIKFWGKFFAFVLSALIGNSSEFKTF